MHEIKVSVVKFGDLIDEASQNDIDPHKFALDLINDFQQSGEGGAA